MELLARIANIYLHVIALGIVTSAYKTLEIGHWFACPGQSLPEKHCQAGTMRVESVTVYATGNTEALKEAENERCRLIPGATNRTIHDKDDQGLSADYNYIYRLIRHVCHGKGECDVVTLPRWNQIHGHFLANESEKMTHRYFAGVLIDAECHTQPVPTEPAPPSTTTASTQATSTAFPVEFFIYQPTLLAIEKIILGVVIGVSLSILLVLLLLIYNWERCKREQRTAEILDEMGKPHAEHDWYEEELFEEVKIDEYSTSKPNEIVTLDRRSLRDNKLQVEEETMSVYSHNSCSTLGRKSNGPAGYVNNCYTYSTDETNHLLPPTRGAPLITVTAPDYDTEENLALEKIMAETIGQSEHPQGSTPSTSSNEEGRLYQIANSQSLPADQASPTTASASPTTAPASPTTAPASPTTAPASPTTVSASPTTVSASLTTASASPTTAPTSPTTAPTSPTTAPASPTTAPASPTTAPASPTTSPNRSKPESPIAERPHHSEVFIVSNKQGYNLSASQAHTMQSCVLVEPAHQTWRVEAKFDNFNKCCDKSHAEGKHCTLVAPSAYSCQLVMVPETTFEATFQDV